MEHGRALHQNIHTLESVRPRSDDLFIDARANAIICHCVKLSPHSESPYPKRCTFVADQVLGDGKSNYIVEEKVERGCDEIDGTRWEHEPW